MANNLKLKEARSPHIKEHAYNIDNGGRRLGIERRQFKYSHYIPERRLGLERRSIPERREDARSEQ
jgi:hypothetical protein